MTAALEPSVAWLDTLRAEFPILTTTSRGRPLVYLDSAATSQKPVAVIDAIDHFYRAGNANIHRGVYQLSEQATVAWDGARGTVANFLHAASAAEVVFVRGTTEAINLVASSFVRPAIRDRSFVLVTEMEHHANIVSWQLAGAKTVAVPVTPSGELDLDEARRLLAERPLLFAFTHLSNALGTVNPVAELCSMARDAGVPTLIDGAQAVPHLEVDVRSMGCDFYCFSGHKLFGPTGIGALWGRAALLEAMGPYQGGGDMIDRVAFEGSTFAEVPRRFEAGTPHIAGAVGLAAAIDWLIAQDCDRFRVHEALLLERATDGLGDVAGVTIHGRARHRSAVVSFTIDGTHAHDVASLLDLDGVCVRAGHHCTQPLHRKLGVAATIRASLAPFNTEAEVDQLISSVRHAAAVLTR